MRANGETWGNTGKLGFPVKPAVDLAFDVPLVRRSAIIRLEPFLCQIGHPSFHARQFILLDPLTKMVLRAFPIVFSWTSARALRSRARRGGAGDLSELV